MVKFLHIIIDLLFLAAVTIGAWLIHPAAGFIVGGVTGLLLHYAVTIGTYDQPGDDE